MRHTHDCSRCISLGEYGDDDLYFCANDLGGATVIARHGSEGGDYSSGMEFAASGRMPALTEAKRRSEMRGFIPATRKLVTVYKSNATGRIVGRHYARTHPKQVTKHEVLAPIPPPRKQPNA